MTSFGIKIYPIKEGRKVVSVKVGWWQKSIDELKDAFAEANRPRIGREERIIQKVEEVVDRQAELGLS